MPGTYLLVWDAPNMDMGLGSILGGRPTAAHRPRFDALGRWVVHQAFAREATPNATVFTNVSPTGAESIRSWVEAIRNVGFGVFAKPKLTEDSDVDPDMLDYIESHRAELTGLTVASADGQNFQELIEELIAESIPVTVLGFREHASWAVSHPDIEFVDLEDIEGVFREPLPRISLDNLPEEGAWLAPLRPLTALVEQQR
ncbi:NYN domain-containing protein [Corynebacterium lizhenjunii]|uniref:NYN domain-containing protein n=1 Tax=Corynebacterium lizhenjunii TaxID=2709394 RepID=UPI0013EBAC3A|nr:NYN domain-containing protein [Corynebacterium lizhenjunii]